MQQTAAPSLIAFVLMAVAVISAPAGDLDPPGTPSASLTDLGTINDNAAAARSNASEASSRAQTAAEAAQGAQSAAQATQASLVTTTAEVRVARDAALGAQAAAEGVEGAALAAQLAAEGAEAAALSNEAQIGVAVSAAQGAQSAAQGAQSAAETAAAGIGTAATAAQGAQAAAQGAQTAAEGAQSAAQTAASAAQGAQTAAQSAASGIDEATVAAQGAQSAAQGAQSAAQGAQSAAESAAIGAGSATTAAQGAQSAAQGAQSEAQSAAAAAQEAQVAAQASHSQAVTNEVQIGVAINAAQGAESAAQSAQSAAQGAQTTAQSAVTAAQGAQSAAQGAQTTAQSAVTAAQGAQNSAQTAASAAQGAQTAAQAAEAAAEAAETAALSGAQDPRLPLPNPTQPLTFPIGIDEPGSYVLVSNITGVSGAHGIEITASDVTIDLNGFSLRGVPGSLRGITVPSSRSNIVIRNGAVRGWGSEGLFLTSATDSVVDGVSAMSNGAAGIQLGPNSVARHCVARGNDEGISTGSNCQVLDCNISDNDSWGVEVQTQSLVRGCAVDNNTGTGVRINGSRTRVEGNQLTRNSSGIFATLVSADTQIVGNTVLNNSTGIGLQGGGVQVAGNEVTGNTTNYNFPTTAQNQLDLRISEIPQTILWPCRATVVGSLSPAAAGSNGITIESSDVTLDLNGQTLLGISGSLAGIRVFGGHSNIVIMNGGVRGWGAEGILMNTASHSRVENVSALQNTGTGIDLGPNSEAVNCVSQGNARGFNTSASCQIIDSSATANSSWGIEVETESVVRGCTVDGNLGTGIRINGSRVVVEHNQVTQNAGGIHATLISTRSQILENYVSNNDTGISLQSGGKRVAGNTVLGNTTNYSFPTTSTNQLDLLICEIPQTIQWPCNATLAGSLTMSTPGVDGITIIAENVTLDLGGHTLTGPGKGATGDSAGIVCSGANGLVLRNGTITEWPGDGVSGEGTNVYEGEITNLVCRSNGGSGIDTEFGYRNRIEGNRCQFNGEWGIRGNGIITRNVCGQNDAGGIQARGTVSMNHSSGNGGDGIEAKYSLVYENTCDSNTGDGIDIQSECRVMDNLCYSNGTSTPFGGGIHVSGGLFNVVVENHCALNGRGLLIDVTSCYSSRNTLSGNGINESLGGSTEGAGDLANVVF